MPRHTIAHSTRNETHMAHSEVTQHTEGTQGHPGHTQEAHSHLFRFIWSTQRQQQQKKQ